MPDIFLFMYIETHHLSKKFEEHQVLSDISFSLPKGARVGIVGANGSGKTTLLRLLAGIETPDEGEVLIQKELTIGYVPQAPEYDTEYTAEEILLSFVGSQEKYRIEKALGMLGLLEHKEKKFRELSSGQKTRVYLARLVAKEPDILLLDEPTNHLDVQALEWLEDYFRGYRGTLCVVSHDRVFLDNITDRIFEIENGTLKEYGGNYSFYKEQKKIEREAYRRSYEAQQKDIKRLERRVRELRKDARSANDARTPKRDNEKYALTFFADRVSKKKDSAAKTIEGRLEKVDSLEKPHTDPKLKMLFESQSPSSQIVAKAESLTYTAEGRKILSDISFTLERGDRALLSGANGAGKTTLIKLLLREMEPDSGQIKLGVSVKPGYLSQEHEALQSSHTVFEELIGKTKIDETLAHRLLSWLSLSREKMKQPVNTLSRGEQSKVLLAELIASGANFIILDEPTNHLDIPAREAIEAALQEYEGTLLIVSHDRYFVRAMQCTQNLQLANGNLKCV